MPTVQGRPSLCSRYAAALIMRAVVPGLITGSAEYPLLCSQPFNFCRACGSVGLGLFKMGVCNALLKR